MKRANSSFLFVLLAWGFCISGDLALGAKKQRVQPPIVGQGRSGLSKPLGVGLVLGEPTGPTFKLWLPEHRAIDAGLAFSLRSFFLIYGDYLLHFPQALGKSSEFVSQLTPYFGGGAVFFLSTNSSRTDAALFTRAGDTFAMGFRIPGGIEWMVPKTDVGIFVELVPGVGFFPSTFAYLQGGVGGRFFF